MSAYYDSAECGHAQLQVDWFRLFDGDEAGKYLLTMEVRQSLHGEAGAYPQNFAVMDDFGTLRLLGRWS